MSKRRNKRNELRDLLAAGYSLQEAISMAGYKDVRREMVRLSGALKSVETKDLASQATARLREFVTAGDPPSVVAAVRELLKRSPASVASGNGACVFVFVDPGCRVEKKHIPSTATAEYASTVEQVGAIIHKRSAGAPETPHDDHNDRELCTRALAKIIASPRVKDATVIAACRETLAELVTPNAAASAERVLAISIYNARGPVPPDATVIYLRGNLKADDVLHALTADDSEAA